MLGSPATFAVKALSRPVITIAPSSAVPSEEPSCIAVFCKPPASLRSSSPTADWTTLPSWETTRPMPIPSTPIAARKEPLSSCGSIVDSSITIATRTTSSPTRTSGRGAKRFASAEPAIAARKRPAEAGSIRTPVSSASSPWTICRKSGIVKKIPIRIRFWASSIETPPRSARMRSSGRWTSGSRPRSSRRRSQATKPARTSAPAPITNGVSEKPNGSIGEAAGASQPQLLACRTPKTISARPEAESTLPTQSRLGAAPLALRLADHPRAEQDADRDDDLADEDVRAS